MDVCGDFIVAHVTRQTVGEGRGDYTLHQQLNCFCLSVQWAGGEKNPRWGIGTFLSNSSQASDELGDYGHDSSCSLPQFLHFPKQIGKEKKTNKKTPHPTIVKLAWHLLSLYYTKTYWAFTVCQHLCGLHYLHSNLSDRLLLLPHCTDEDTEVLKAKHLAQGHTDKWRTQDLKPRLSSSGISFNEGAVLHYLSPQRVCGLGRAWGSIKSSCLLAGQVLNRESPVRRRWVEWLPGRDIMSLS